ncbi:uncharacterized protein K460DRAFT_368918 [Cucurbitaria berberidis CBS 394.84]|uniref:Secreted protein n=1 Tax=Cucurbitaria berberidis CBS 394.84 TaxID=1168544 RepID=A0A9P4L6K8_9PLEO|nr:uncharacterized protein K460DRAFT_368918 [Cucurbitaria berberidis CBS 394.84]KAF1844056.1 hypothetical protein K460DRAFT_368918 [Cucurbitaria berberidis CBS 394.84]
MQFPACLLCCCCCIIHSQFGLFVRSFGRHNQTDVKGQSVNPALPLTTTPYTPHHASAAHDRNPLPSSSLAPNRMKSTRPNVPTSPAAR